MSKPYSIAELFYTKWQHLTYSQMMTVIDLRYRLDQAKKEELWKSYGYFSIMILRELRKNKRLVAKINERQAVDCLNDLAFIREPWYFFPNVGGGLLAPDEYMHNLIFNQLVYADAAFTRYCVKQYRAKQTNTEADTEAEINELIGILYTPANLFDDKLIDYRASMACELKPYIKALILHTYANVREYISKRCPALFNIKKNEEPTETPPMYTGKMWQTILFNLSETPTFPGLEKAEKASLYKALDYLEQKAIENEQPKKQHA
jgi:hypothetical protein